MLNMPSPQIENIAAKVPDPPQWRYRLLGAGMLLISGGLLTWFTISPKGGLSFAPQIWKGIPLLLLSCFLGCCGGLLLILRRYSLTALLLSIFMAGLVTSIAHKNVSEFSAVDRRHVLRVTPDQRDRISDDVITTDRLLHFCQDVIASKVINISSDFHQIRINKENNRVIAIDFTYNPLIFKNRSKLRPIITAYANFIAQFELMRELDLPERLKFVSVNRNLWTRRSRSRCRSRMDFALTYLNDRLPYRISRGHALSMHAPELTLYYFPKDLLPEYKFLAKREPDPKIKAFLNMIVEAGER